MDSSTTLQSFDSDTTFRSMDSDIDSCDDLSDDSDTDPSNEIIVACGGDGMKLPKIFDVCASTENTIAGFKDIAILTAQGKGYTEYIDPETMMVTFFDNDMRIVIYGEEDIKLKKLKKFPTQPRFALLIIFTHVSKKIVYNDITTRSIAIYNKPF